MIRLKLVSVGVALLLGAAMSGTGQASAAPLANLSSGFLELGPPVELAQARRRDRLTCGQARRIVRLRYNRVRTIECRGRIYTFAAVTRRGRPVNVSINSRTASYWHTADRVSCREARRIVNRRFDRVRTIECRGRIYTFRAVNNRGKRVRISVNSRTGNWWRS